MSSTVAAPDTKANTKPLAFMQRLHPLVSVYRPPETSASSTGDPRLIIIASWTDARDAHIAKYVVKYQTLYPHAQILLFKSTTTNIFQPATIGPAVKHAVPVIDAAFTPSSLSPGASQPELLIHMLSNGGSSNIANLYEQYAVTPNQGDQNKRLPPHVTVCDSCPGVWSIPRAVAFINVGLSPFQKLLAAPILYACGAAWSLLMAVGVLPDSLGAWGRAHNNHPGNSAEMRRSYIYSAGDALIDPKAVEQHAADAKAKGFSVELHKFDDSAHVAHMKKDEKRYWDIVTKTFQGSQSSA